ncbi:hypothetical protein [Archangium sp.]|uniref:hypothetical protein n=1 Tax=Archangium sp. TaxID=1872627 RepID=UPI002D2D32C2|nr:hypothetical protein [Archangium sp.]HYO57235.1 hypothetical protein [Archangium sp.]
MTFTHSITRLPIQGLFNGLDTCPTSTVYIVLNYLSPNDTLDFIVDNGGNGVWCDTVGLSAMITSLY